MSDYTGKIVYVGIDVHKKTYAIACICENEVVHKASLPAEPEQLIHLLKKQFTGAEIYTVYEAGLTGFYLHRKLLDAGINNRVVNPASVEISARNRVKTDKRDAKKLAEQLAAGRLKGIYVPDEKQEARRSVSRLRQTVVSDKTRCANRIKGLLTLNGYTQAEYQKPLTAKSINNLLLLSGDEEWCFTLKEYIQQWLRLSEQIKQVEKRLKAQAKACARIHEIYRSMPGIGFVNAQTLANELGDLKQFTSNKKLSGFSGFTPIEYSSGESCRRGHISRQGRALVRKILIQVAWVAIRHDKALQQIHLRIGRTRGTKRAITAVARRIFNRLRSCFVQDCLYKTGMGMQEEQLVIVTG